MSGEPTLGSPAWRRRGWPTAPPPIAIVIAVDAWMLATAVALLDVGWPWYLLPFAIAVIAMWVSGRAAARALGIRTLDETPRGSSIILGLLGGMIGVTAGQAGRYAGFAFTVACVLLQVGERVVWARFHDEP